MKSLSDLLFEQVRKLREENERLREIVNVVKDAVDTEMDDSPAFVAWGELVWDLYDMLYGSEEE